MTMQTDVKAVTLTADGYVYQGRTRIKGMVITTSIAGVGSISIKDGGSGGTSKLLITATATADCVNVVIPGEGVLFETDAYADLSNISSVTVFHG
jgi:hypothetical protein